MENISVALERTGSISNLYKTIDQVLGSNPMALTLLLAAGNDFTEELLNPLLTQMKIPMSGGVFPKLIFKENILEKGSIIIGWNKPVSIINYKNIGKTDSIKDLVGSIPLNTSQDIKGKHLIFIDGAVSKLEETLDALYKKKGFQVTFAGCGAGTLSNKNSACIVSNEGLLKNTLQTVATNHSAKTTVTHGLKRESGPHLVTNSERSTVQSLNYESVVSMYQKHHESHGSRSDKGQEFSEYFSSYPLGIENLDGELLVREPMSFTDSSVNYVGNIPEYSKVYILSGTQDSSRDEVDNELYSLKLREEENIDVTFIFSCLHRDDVEQGGNSKEVKMLNQHLMNSNNIIGVLSLGEIATSQHRLLQLHSKTIVITRLASEI